MSTSDMDLDAPRVLAIASGKGGVGKSNITINLGVSLAKRGKSVLLVDADLGLANLDILLGVSSERTIADVVAGRCRLPDVVVDGPAGLSLLPAGSGVLVLERLTTDQRRHLVGELRELAGGYDYVLIDTGAGLTPNVLLFSAVADGVLVVTRPEPTAITDAYALIKVLAQNYQIDNVALLVNQTLGTGQGERVHERLATVCARFLQVELRYLGSLPQDRAVERAVQARQALLLVEPQAPAAVACTALGGRLAGLFPPLESVGERWQRLLAPPAFRVAADGRDDHTARI